MGDTRPLDQLPAGTTIEAGDVITIRQTLVLEGGILSNPDPADVYQDTGERQVDEAAKQGWLLEFLPDPFGWLPAGTDANGDEVWKFEWEHRVIRPSDRVQTAAAFAGLAILLFAAAAFVAAFFFGTVRVLEEAGELFKSEGFEEFVEETGSTLRAGAFSGVMIAALVLLAVVMRR